MQVSAYPIKNIADNLTQRETNPKYYFVDNGIISILAMDVDTSLLENMVAMALPRGTTGSLSPTFVPARLVGLAVKLLYAFTLCE